MYSFKNQMYVFVYAPSKNAQNRKCAEGRKGWKGGGGVIASHDDCAVVNLEFNFLSS